jgi:hypothetical protein
MKQFCKLSIEWEPKLIFFLSVNSYKGVLETRLMWAEQTTFPPRDFWTLPSAADSALKWEWDFWTLPSTADSALKWKWDFWTLPSAADTALKWKWIREPAKQHHLEKLYSQQQKRTGLKDKLAKYSVRVET